MDIIEYRYRWYKPKGLNRLFSIVMIYFLVAAGLLALFLGMPDSNTAVSGATHSVGSASPESFATIQDAVNASVNGDTILVYPGTYSGPITINKSIELIGIDRESTVLDGKDNSTMIAVDADDVIIKNLMIINTSLYFYPNNIGITINDANNVEVVNCNISYHSVGIRIELSENVTVRDSELYFNNMQGIYIDSSKNLNITNNTIALKKLGGGRSGQGHGAPDVQGKNGITMYLTNDVSIKQNKIFNLNNGIISYYSNNIKILDNWISNHNYYGISFSNNERAEIKNNHVLENGYGIYLSMCLEADIQGNTMVNNSILIEISMWNIWQIEYLNSHTVTTNNTVNGKPVYYYTGAEDIALDGIEVGQLILASSKKITVSNIEITRADTAVTIAEVSDIKFINCTINSNNNYGIEIVHSNNILLENIKVKSNSLNGIDILYSSDVSVYWSDLGSNGYSDFSSISAQNVTLIGNDFKDNYESVSFHSTSGSVMHHNNFINTSYYDWYQGGITFNNGYPSGGNYYYNYEGIDEKSGNNQDKPGSDGIGDTPHVQDIYPLMKPFVALPPDPPGSVSAVEANSMIRLNWELPDTTGTLPLTGLRIYRGTSPGLLSLLAEIDVDNFYYDSTITHGFTYYYRISSVSELGESEQSSEVSSIIPTVPSAPRNVTAEAGDSFVFLSWEPPEFDGGMPVLDYNIFWGSKSGQEYYHLDTINQLNFTDNQLENGKMYNYKIQAANSVGEGSFSESVSAMPLALPSEPRSLSAIAGVSSILLQWNKPVSTGGFQIINYKIYKGVSSSVLFHHTDIGDVQAFEDHLVSPAITYYYSVSACTTLGEGKPAGEVNATIFTEPSRPVDFKVTSGDGYVNLDWGEPDFNGGKPVLNFYIYRSTKPLENHIFDEIDGNAYHYNDTDVNNGVKYYYKLEAVNQVGRGPSTNELSAIPDVPKYDPPVVSTIVNKTTGKAPLTVYFKGFCSLNASSLILYDWDFDDGDTSFEPDPTHTFTQPGIYYVTLTVTDEHGEFSTAMITIIVEPANEPKLGDDTLPDIDPYVDNKNHTKKSSSDDGGAYSMMCFTGVAILAMLVVADRIILSRTKRRGSRTRSIPPPPPPSPPPELSRTSGNSYPEPIILDKIRLD
jgi:parallel beta-helix repeat protein